MATVTGLTAERMLEIENASVVNGHVSSGDLILVTKGGTDINAGYVAGPAGPSGGAYTICTSTTRPAIHNEGLAIYETDTKLVRVWNGTRWRIQERVICTSTTRPTGLVSADEGLRIYETDTNLGYTWDGIRWKIQERIVCTSTTRPTGMVAADEGIKIYETDTNLEFIWSGTAWGLATVTAGNVPKFADATERAANFPAPADGSLSYLANSPAILWAFHSGVWNTTGPPAGSCMPWIGTVAPLYHALMYGQTITSAQTLYPVLWANLDSTWKSGSSLIVPDMRGRIPAGKDNMGGTAAARLTSPLLGTGMGNNGGSQNMQGHNHAITQTPHSHGTGETLTGPGAYGMAAGGKEIKQSTFDASIIISLATAGIGSSENIQPTIILNWIIKLL